MRWVTLRRTRRRAGTAAAVLALLAGAVGCDAGDDISGDEEAPQAGSSQATDTPEVATVLTLQHVGDRLDAAHREKVKDAVTPVVDSFFDGAYLGDFPRDDYAAAFSAFTQGAAADAQRDLDVLTSASLSDRIETATATKRRVTLDVLAVHGHARGATAHFFLDFDTTGDLEESLRVRGELYLTKTDGAWTVFGYDVDEPEVQA
jgi:hypothetical protein